MLSTIGYEGAKPENFLRTLVAAEVDFIIDVRDRAQSRRPGFSKTSLADSLSSVGIGYLHLRELGDPKEGRAAARANDLVTFRKIYSQVLASDAAKEAIAKILSTAKDVNVCLLCYERNPDHCHRTMIADTISQLTGEQVRKLGVGSFEQTIQ